MHHHSILADSIPFMKTFVSLSEPVSQMDSERLRSLCLCGKLFLLSDYLKVIIPGKPIPYTVASFTANC
jgi:hypothetical protein